MGRLAAFEPPPADYRNHLATDGPERLVLPSARWLLVGLVALCLVPRVLMALRIPSICPDGVLYVELAKNIEAGNFRAAFHDMAVNIYPIILVILHRLGFEWEHGAMLWGVVVSSFVVLPLWGWIRRQFDDRVALVACLLYAIHTKFIEWSPEVMRDPTFWLLFMLAVYFLWRATTEIRFGWFVAAGCAIVLASLTRIEGAFLLIPLVLWTFWRWRALGKATSSGGTNWRRRLLIGATLGVAVLPFMLALGNIAWLCGHSGGLPIFRTSALARVHLWLQSLVGSSPVRIADDGSLPPLSFGRMVWVFIPTMTRGLGPIFALLMFGGIWGWRRVWSRRDHQALFITAMVVMFGIWVQLWFDKAICPRYALTIVLMASPWASLGLLGLTSRLIRLFGRDWSVLHWRSLFDRPAADEIARRAPRIWRRRTAVCVGLLAITAAVNVGDAMTSSESYFATRRMSRELGLRLAPQYRTPPNILGPAAITPIVCYYAGTQCYTVVINEGSDPLILVAVEKHAPDIVLLRPWKGLTERRCALLAEEIKKSGFAPIRAGFVDAPEQVLRVLVRKNRLDLVQNPMRRR